MDAATRRAAAADATAASRAHPHPAPPIALDVAAFDRSSLTVYLNDALTLVFENRPEDPIAFCADYLRRVLSGAGPVPRAYQFLTLCPHHRTAFIDNAVVAFGVLEKERGGVSAGDAKAVMQMLCADFPREVAVAVLRALGRGDDDDAEDVDFFEFLGGVRACLAFEEALGEVERAFAMYGAADGDDAAGGGDGGENENENENVVDARDDSRTVPKSTLRDVLRRVGEDVGKRGDKRWDDFRALSTRVVDAIPGTRVTFSRFATAVFRAMAPSPSPASGGGGGVWDALA